MKVFGLFVLCACMPLLPTSAQTIGWRGIVPLHSTRADVEKKLGKPNFKYELYDLDAERVNIVYTNEPCSGGMRGGYTVPRDTVLSIEISPKKKVMLSDTAIDLRNYKKTTDPLIEVHSFYSNEEDGITIGTFEGGGADNGKVLRIHYGPTAKDTQLRCSTGNKSAYGTKQIGDSSVPVSDPCPTIVINEPSANDCSQSVYSFAATLAGVDPRFNAKYKWSLSEGMIIHGQKTNKIAVQRTTTSTAT